MSTGFWKSGRKDRYVVRIASRFVMITTSFRIRNFFSVKTDARIVDWRNLRKADLQHSGLALQMRELDSLSIFCSVPFDAQIFI